MLVEERQVALGGETTSLSLNKGACGGVRGIPVFTLEFKGITTGPWQQPP